MARAAKFIFILLFGLTTTAGAGDELPADETEPGAPAPPVKKTQPVHIDDIAAYYKGLVAKNSDAFKPLAKVTDWDQDTFRHSLEFATARTELGESFKPALLKFIGGNVDRHYYAALFLTSPSFLQGHRSLPRLALSILRQGLVILHNLALPRKTAFHFQAAILAQQLGYKKMARYHKQNTRILERRFPGSIPAVSKKAAPYLQTDPLTADRVVPPK